VEVIAGFARAPGARVVADLAPAREVEVVAGLALEAGSGCLVDADFAVCDEVAGRLGVLLDPLVLGEVVEPDVPGGGGAWSLGGHARSRGRLWGRGLSQH
jgi:hypothetical protein